MTKPPRGSYLSVLLRPKAYAVEDDLRNHVSSIVTSQPRRNNAAFVSARHDTNSPQIPPKLTPSTPPRSG